MRNMDVTTLRSFVAVADLGGVTRAATHLNLTQSAVSMQLKRLEELLGLSLFDRTGRRIALSPGGEQLLTYARRMVELNDAVMARLTDRVFEGEITLGVPVDIVYPAIPRVLQLFNAEFPRMKVQLVSSFTTQLKAQFARGEMDVILTTEDKLHDGGETLSMIPLRWVGAPDGGIWRQRPLRLAFCRYCGFRQGALRKLDAAGIPWEMAVESESDRTIEATVSADLGITAILEGHAPAHLSYVPQGAGLPDLGLQMINLYAAPSGTEVTDRLCAMLRQAFDAPAAVAPPRLVTA